MNKIGNIYYCFEIEGSIFLTNSPKYINIQGKKFYHYSNLKLDKADFSDSSSSNIQISGFYHKRGISYDVDLLYKVIKIYIYLEDELDLYHLATYQCTKVIKGEGYFSLFLESILKRLDKKIMSHFSATCRAIFCGSQCGLNKKDFTSVYTIDKIMDNIVTVKSLSKPDNYYAYGEAWVEEDPKKFRILEHSDNLFKLDGSVSSVATSISVISACDKNFQTCCNRYNNSVNFRGEPFIPVLPKWS